MIIPLDKLLDEKEEDADYDYIPEEDADYDYIPEEDADYDYIPEEYEYISEEKYYEDDEDIVNYNDDYYEEIIEAEYNTNPMKTFKKFYLIKMKMK